MSSEFFPPGIHPSATIESGAIIGENVSIGAYSYIGPGVTIRDNVQISRSVVIGGKTTIGENTQIYPLNVLGTPGQDLKYPDFSEGTLVIGKNNIIREKCSIHAGTPAHGTVIGDKNFIMSETHIGHDCIIGNHIIIASVGLSGHVEVEDHVVLGAKSGFHQFCRIGQFAMVSGVSAITKDVPPFALSEHERPNEFSGINVIGLKRRGFKKEDLQTIRKIYDTLYSMKGAIANRIEPLRQEFGENPFGKIIIEFLEKSKRNVCTPPRSHKQTEEESG
ncbi:MAG: acyl-ACP--UDP-N-acetylglucosamine O-acyltransferase [Leptospiraceae bacterium]|nr:acyl-ACP--UDP-N-acetylglucosamine O-acyltransferase [Leptospiraceae bacterium]MCP5511574.1 acyl-ACP--UDP-N-acetylglucosamine O-acyltransferase [Leptospiraceae bacterium]